MVNVGRLVFVLANVVLSVQPSAAADLVNGLNFSQELTKLGNDVLGVEKMQVR